MTKLESIELYAIILVTEKDSYDSHNRNAHYGNKPVNTCGHRFYSDKAAECRYHMLLVSDHKGLFDNQSERMIL